MKKKIVFKSMLTLMTVSILPFSNFGVFAQPSQSTSSPKTAVSGLSKALKLPSVFADDSTPTNETNSNGLVPTTSEPQKSVTAPARPAVATNPYTEAMAPSSFGYQSSINGLPNVASGQISVIAGTSSVFNATVSDANVQAALAYINANGSSSTDYVLFIGGSVTLSSTTTGNSGNAGSFSGLAGHAKSLTIVSNTADSLTSSTTAAASGNATITYNQSFYLGVPTVIRNATLAQSSDALYAQGNAFATTVGSSITGGPAIYGGNDGNSNLSSDTNIYLGAYGAGTWNIYGGDDTGSGSATLTGNTHVSIAGLNGPSINNLSGGNNTGGIINGNTSLSLTKFGGTVSNIYGAGVGSSSAYVKVNGNVATNINSSQSPSYGIVFGGALYGNITGTIYNTFMGGGGWSANPGHFIGGSYLGNIGTQGKTINAIQTTYDTSNFTTGYNGYFTGGRDTAAVSTSGTAYGNIYGNITNYVRASFSANAGTMYSVIGGDGPGTARLGTSVTGMPSAGFGGGNGNNITQSTTVAANDPASYDAKIQAASAAGNTGVTAIYGNIYTWEQGGYMADQGTGSGYIGYNRSGSYNGYVNGTTTIECGTLNADGTVGGNGAVSGSSSNTANVNSATAYPYSNDGTKQRGNNSVFEVASGGACLDGTDSYWHTGDSYTVQNNIVARWTYGGQYSGFQWGNANNILNAGIVSQLVGNNYGGAVQWGDSTAQMNGGELDRNITGASFGQMVLKGNAYAVVYGGLVNGIVSGLMTTNVGGYGIIQGNSTLDVYGGDFSGKQDTNIIGSTKSFSPGIFSDPGTHNRAYSGITGSTYTTIDLTGPTGPTFKLPTSTFITAGTPYGNNNGNIGSGSSSSENLTIITPKGNDVFNGATVYGDGCDQAWGSTTYNGNNVGSININIKADGATFGNAYATNAAYASSSGLLGNSTVSIGDGVTVTGNISAGSSSDNLTNTIVSKNSNTMKITLGDSTTGDQVLIKGKVSNFTDLQVAQNSSVIVAGGLLNGSSATANNHAATYSAFGNILLNNNATLGVSTTTSVISGGKLTAGRSAQLSSPYVNTAGLINFSDLAFNAGGGLTWTPTGTATAPTSTYSGAYWGQQKGFPVLTFNGGTANTGSGAYNITPGNFQGVDSANNYAFLGDYTQTQVTTPTGPTWIGYVVPGQIRVFNTADANAGTLGNWTHNLTGVTTGTPTPGTAMSAWSDTPAGTASNSIRIMYTMQYANSVNPAFNFASATGSYVQSRSASRYDGGVLNNYSSYSPNFTVNPDGSTTGGAVPNFSTNDYFTGNQQNGSNDQSTFGSYIIESAVTNNQSVLNVARNSIVNNTKATSLTVAQLEGILGVSGTGIVSDLKLSSPTLSTINSGIANANGGTYNSLPVKFTMDSATANANLVIVPDHATISADGQNALDVYDATLTGDEAHAITTDVNSITPNESAKPPVYANGVNYYTGFGNAGNVPLAITADGTVSTPTLSNKAALIAALQAIADSGTLTANYTFNGLTMNAVLTINVGYLEFTSAPANIDWGKLSVSPKELTAYPTYSGDASGATGTGQIIVTDTRTGSQATPWTLVVAASAPFAQNDGKGNNSLASYLMLNNGASKVNLTSANTLVHSETSKTPGVYNLNQNWGSASGQGIYLDVPVNGQHIGSYQGQLTWTLSSVPGNN